MKSSVTRDAFALVVLVMLGVVGRVLPHAPTFTPLAATALFAGYYISRRSVAIAVPLLGMALSDAIIGTYDWRIMASVYLSLLVPIALRTMIRVKPGGGRIMASALVSSLAFYAITNFAVWYFGIWYTRDFAGFIRCYAAGLPFLKYTIAGNLFWSMMLFGLYGLAARFVLPALSDSRRSAVCSST